MPAFAATALALGLGLSGVGEARANDPFTVAKYPVEAEASDAVKAKEAAISFGQTRAFRSLMKRLLPVTAYQRIPRLTAEQVDGLLDGFAVRKEENSRTVYIATLDFRFRAPAVQSLLASYGLAPVVQVAEPTVLVPIFVPTMAGANAVDPALRGAASEGETPAPGVGLRAGQDEAEAKPVAGLDAARGQALWQRAWTGLDLKNSLTPLIIRSDISRLAPSVIEAVLSGDGGALRAAQSEFGTERIVFAHLTPNPDGRHLRVRLAGQDAVGAFALDRRYPIDAIDVGFTAELATVVGLGIIEGRWKSVAGGAAVAAAGAAGPVEDVTVVVTFSGLAEWQQLRRRIGQMPGLAGFDTGTVSARGAELYLKYPGGAAGLQPAFANLGLTLNDEGGVLTARRY